MAPLDAQTLISMIVSLCLEFGLFDFLGVIVITFVVVSGYWVDNVPIDILA